MHRCCQPLSTLPFPGSSAKRACVSVPLNRCITASSTTSSFWCIYQMRCFGSATRQIVSAPVVYTGYYLVLKVVVTCMHIFMQTIKSACSTGVADTLLALLSCTHFNWNPLCCHSCRYHPFSLHSDHKQVNVIPL